MHTTNDSVVMAMTKNMEHILAPSPDAAMDVFSYMRPIADENVKNLYSNLQSASMYMSKTQQMAKIIPSPVSIPTNLCSYFPFFFFVENTYSLEFARAERVKVISSFSLLQSVVSGVS